MRCGRQPQQRTGRQVHRAPRPLDRRIGNRASTRSVSSRASAWRLSESAAAAFALQARLCRISPDLDVGPRFPATDLPRESPFQTLRRAVRVGRLPTRRAGRLMRQPPCLEAEAWCSRLAAQPSGSVSASRPHQSRDDRAPVDRHPSGGCMARSSRIRHASAGSVLRF